MIVGIYTNLDRDIGLDVTKRLIQLLSANGIGCICHNSLSGKVECGVFFDENKITNPPELMFVLGGDGTILSASTFCSKYNIPILGINLGNVGFLTEIEPSEIETCLMFLLNGKYKLSKHSMLNVVFDDFNVNALNDIYISRSGNEKSTVFQVSVRGELISSFFGDGYLVSSPVGSTAYSLSAGGPIVSSDVECMILTPLNAHSLFSRSVVVGGNEEVVISAHSNDVSVIADGKTVGQTDKYIVVKKSELSTAFVVINDKKFYSKLRSKMSMMSILPQE